MFLYNQFTQKKAQLAQQAQNQIQVAQQAEQRVVTQESQQSSKAVSQVTNAYFSIDQISFSQDASLQEQGKSLFSSSFFSNENKSEQVKRYKEGIFLLLQLQDGLKKIHQSKNLLSNQSASQNIIQERISQLKKFIEKGESMIQHLQGSQLLLRLKYLLHDMYQNLEELKNVQSNERRNETFENLHRLNSLKLGRDKVDQFEAEVNISRIRALKYLKYIFEEVSMNSSESMMYANQIGENFISSYALNPQQISQEERQISIEILEQITFLQSLQLSLPLKQEQNNKKQNEEILLETSINDGKTNQLISNQSTQSLSIKTDNLDQKIQLTQQDKNKQEEQQQILQYILLQEREIFEINKDYCKLVEYLTNLVINCSPESNSQQQQQKQQQIQQQSKLIIILLKAYPCLSLQGKSGLITFIILQIRIIINSISSSSSFEIGNNKSSFNDKMLQQALLIFLSSSDILPQHEQLLIKNECVLQILKESSKQLSFDNFNLKNGKSASIIVPPRSQHVILIEVLQTESIIHFAAAIESKDIQLQLTFEGSLQQKSQDSQQKNNFFSSLVNSNASKQVRLSNIKLEANSPPYRFNFLAGQEGLYSLTLNNTSSLFQQKKVTYRIHLLTPQNLQMSPLLKLLYPNQCFLKQANNFTNQLYKINSTISQIPKSLIIFDHSLVRSYFLRNNQAIQFSTLEFDINNQLEAVIIPLIHSLLLTLENSTVNPPPLFSALTLQDLMKRNVNLQLVEKTKANLFFILSNDEYQDLFSIESLFSLMIKYSFPEISIMVYSFADAFLSCFLGSHPELFINRVSLFWLQNNVPYCSIHCGEAQKLKETEQKQNVKNENMEEEQNIQETNLSSTTNLINDQTKLSHNQTSNETIGEQSAFTTPFSNAQNEQFSLFKTALQLLDGKEERVIVASRKITKILFQNSQQSLEWEYEVLPFKFDVVNFILV